MTGECETLYEIASMSDALVRSDSKLNPLPKICAAGTFFQVVKTKDYSKCRSNKPVYNVIAPSGWKCKPGNAACGTARSVCDPVVLDTAVVEMPHQVALVFDF